MSYGDQAGRAKLPTTAGVVLVHVAIAYALLSGLAIRVIRQIDPPLRTYPVEADKDPPPPHPMPRVKVEPRASAQPAPVPETPLVPLPPIDRIDLSKLRTADPIPFPTVDPVPSPSAPSQASEAVARGSRASWIGTDDYPASSLRAGAAGTVGISVTIGANGRASSCAVTRSSGDAALDAATCRLYSLRARYTPARDASGTAVETRIADRVTWRIPE